MMPEYTLPEVFKQNVLSQGIPELIKLLQVIGLADTHWLEKSTKQEFIMDTLTRKARENKTWVGRILRFSMCDSYAYYVITRMNLRTVRVEWVDYCDGWESDIIGKAGVIDGKIAREQIEFQDEMNHLFTINHIHHEVSPSTLPDPNGS